MENFTKGTNLKPLIYKNGTQLYKLDAPHLSNHYYVASNPATIKLMMLPEVVGYDTYAAPLAPTITALEHFKECGLTTKTNILTILRGGLNYPLEESCYRCGIQVDNMSFLSCERVISPERVITGLDIRYKKNHIDANATMLIGDIIATGDTLVKCINYIFDEYQAAGTQLRRMIFFTIGGTRAINVLEELTAKARQLWPSFQGIHCVFFEGIFAVYENRGVTGINIPDIDFYWNGGVIAPQFRKAVVANQNALFERCIIYDGGARRYEIPDHYHEATEYWESLANIANEVNLKDFIEEKLGYSTPITFDAWLEVNHFIGLKKVEMKRLYEAEQALVAKASEISLSDVCQLRLQQIKSALGKYI